MKAATVKMTCGHDTIYLSPYPVEGQVGWCHRCETFKGVVHAKPMNLNQDNVITGYTKQPELTDCYNGEPRWFY